jgi:hypothetical protein
LCLERLRRYAKHIPEDATDVQIVGNFNSELSGEGHQTSDADADEKCALILDALISYLQEQTGKPVAFVAKGENEDFALMVNAPTLIGSISTYALWAGIANGNGNVILPNCTLFHGMPNSPLAPPLPYMSVPGVRMVAVEAVQSWAYLSDRGIEFTISDIPTEKLIRILAGQPQGGTNEDRVLKWDGSNCLEGCAAEERSEFK